MTDWDERFESGQYPRDPEPSGLLRRYVDALPAGRALDVATGTGRNAVFLAERGYHVDALDASRVGLETTHGRAAERGVDDRIELVQTDVPTYEFPADTYDLVTISFYRAVDRFADMKESLTEGGVLFVEHHLRTTDSTSSGPSGDRYRFAANELLRSMLDLTVLAYEERTEARPDGRNAAIARVVARNTSGQRQSYPPLEAAYAGT
ncbi:MAG: class I SAM-dependent methyltransferase [Halobacteriota archaeon]|uniref:class I SAM-dependent methyltransferase n=1 Tax=Natronomonas sp. TaxID=2184060 RepID=UPI0039763BB8